MLRKASVIRSTVYQRLKRFDALENLRWHPVRYQKAGTTPSRPEIIDELKGGESAKNTTDVAK